MSWSYTHTPDKYSPYCSDHILLSGFGVSGGPDIPKLSAGQGLSSLTMNRSTHPRHSSREVFVGTRKRHHGRVGIAKCAVPSLYNPFWLHVWEFLMASRMGRPWGFLRLSLLECFTCFSLHLYSLPHLGFDFCGAKLVKGAADKIPMLYFACFLSSLLVMPDLPCYACAERMHEIIWSYALHLSLLTAPENRKPRRRCFSR